MVDELRLDATSEQIWAQVQKQREGAEAAADALPTVRSAAAQAVAAATSPAAGRRRVRGWREIKGWVWVLFWCCGGLGLVTAVLHPSYPALAVSINGDARSLTADTHGENVEVNGDKGTLTLQGNCPTLTITGDGNHVRVVGSVGRVITDGDGNRVTYADRLGPAPAVSGGGDGNTVTPASPTP